MIVVLVLLRMCTDQVQDEVRVCNLPLQCNFSTIQLVLIDDEGVFHYRSCIKAMSFIVFQRSLKSLRPQGATSDGESGRAFLTCNKQRAHHRSASRLATQLLLIPNFLTRLYILIEVENIS
jgi:hypothetical protein